MKKIFLSLLVVFLLGRVAFAAVELKSNGTLVGKVETIDITGAEVTVTNKDAVMEADHVTTGFFADGSIYLTGANGLGATLWMTQEDGGCSRCTVAANGSTFACLDQTCPDGM